MHTDGSSQRAYNVQRTRLKCTYAMHFGPCAVDHLNGALDLDTQISLVERGKWCLWTNLVHPRSRETMLLYVFLNYVW